MSNFHIKLFWGSQVFLLGHAVYRCIRFVNPLLTKTSFMCTYVRSLLRLLGLCAVDTLLCPVDVCTVDHTSTVPAAQMGILITASIPREQIKSFSKKYSLAFQPKVIFIVPFWKVRHHSYCKLSSYYVPDMVGCEHPSSVGVMCIHLFVYTTHSCRCKWWTYSQQLLLTVLMLNKTRHTIVTHSVVCWNYNSLCHTNFTVTSYKLHVIRQLDIM